MWLDLAAVNTWDFVKKMTENAWGLLAGVALVSFNTGRFTEKARRDHAYVSNATCLAHHEALEVKLDYLKTTIDKIDSKLEGQPSNPYSLILPPSS